jgi:hypothetical protein
MAALCHVRFVADGLGNIAPPKSDFPAVIPFLISSSRGATFAVLIRLPLDILTGWYWLTSVLSRAIATSRGTARHWFGGPGFKFQSNANFGAGKYRVFWWNTPDF